MQNLFKTLGYHCYWHWCDDPRGGPGKWGCLYASKLEPKNVQFGMQGGLNNEGRVITAFYEKFCVPCTYTPCSEWNVAVPMNRRVEHCDRFREHVRQLENPIVLGDFNCAPQDVDSWKSNDLIPSTKPYERQLFSRLLEVNGLVDVFRVLHPTPNLDSFTWHRTPQQRKMGNGMRIDHVLTRAE